MRTGKNTELPVGCSMLQVQCYYNNAKRTCWSCHLYLFMAHFCFQHTRKQSASINWTEPWLRAGCLKPGKVLDASGIEGNSLHVYSHFTNDSHKIPEFNFFLFPSFTSVKQI